LLANTANADYVCILDYRKSDPILSNFPKFTSEYLFENPSQLLLLRPSNRLSNLKLISHEKDFYFRNRNRMPHHGINQCKRTKLY
jgi:hypothetical protein